MVKKKKKEKTVPFFKLIVLLEIINVWQYF